MNILFFCKFEDAYLGHTAELRCAASWRARLLLTWSVGGPTAVGLELGFAEPFMGLLQGLRRRHL